MSNIERYNSNRSALQHSPHRSPASQSDQHHSSAATTENFGYRGSFTTITNWNEVFPEHVMATLQSRGISEKTVLDGFMRQDSEICVLTKSQVGQNSQWCTTDHIQQPNQKTRRETSWSSAPGACTLTGLMPDEQSESRQAHSARRAAARVVKWVVAVVALTGLITIMCLA